MKKQPEPVTVEKIKETHRLMEEHIRLRLAEFSIIWKEGSDEKLWEEMVFCFFTGGCSAKMGLRSIEAVRSLLLDGDFDQLSGALSGVHRYPFARSRYIIASRQFLSDDCQMKIKSRLTGVAGHHEKRDWLAKESGIKGLGYKEASHFLRNIGLKGYAILDKHVLKCLTELKIIDSPKPPNTRQRYLTIETKLKTLSKQIEIDFDELDLVLWFMKTGEILK